MGLNLVYLAFIALVPFTSEVLGDYPRESAAVVLYAGALFGVSLVFAIQIVYAYRMGLVKPQLHVVERRYAGPTSFLVAAVFFVSMLVAVFAPLAAMLMWLLIFAAGNRVSDRIAEYLSAR
jgi:uncharacterized membrane protein